ncbi:MAG: galactose ABC transporter substrate-binding protein [Rectinemataceae bacterium]|nr:galactose ABC transporter substrate-binding protein [Rectinemataceae bacterium]
MKKLLIAFAVIAVIFASCGGAASGKPKIGVAIYKFDDTFMSYVRNAITENATDKAEVEVVDSQNAQPTQNDQVDAFLSKKMKAIAINPVDRTAAAAIIEKAKAKKTPVVFFNREPLADDMKSWDKVYYVGAKAEQSGTMQGQIVVDYWKANPAADKNKDGKIQYIMLKGEPGHQDAELRTQFSIQAITDAGIGVDKLAEDTAMWDRPKAFEKMKAFYAANGDKIEVVLCNNDDMALGAIEALKSEGYFAGTKQIVVVGVDATAPALQAVEEGTLLGTVLNDAKNQGKATFDLAFAVAKGEDVTKTGWEITDGKYVWVPYQMVTKENYTQFK